MTSALLPRLCALALLSAVAFAGSGGCSGQAEEGEACNRKNGNDDCESGLICRGEWEVRAKESVCCPPPPVKPGVDACKPQIEHAHPDPSVDASFGAGGSGGAGGSAGSSGSSGSSGSAGSAGTAGLDSGSDAADAQAEAAADAADDALDAPLDSAEDDGG
jgi:hypothetical protein